MSVNLSGTWKAHEKDHENFDEFLSAMRKGPIEKKMAKSVTMKQKIEQNGDEFNVVMITPKGNKSNKATIGQESEFELPSGEKFKAKPNWEGSKLVAKGSGPGGKEFTMIRELQGDRMLQTIIIKPEDKEIVFKRYFDRVAE